MTPRQPPGGEPTAARNTMPVNRFTGVAGATRKIPAIAIHRPERTEGRQRPVRLNEPKQNAFHAASQSKPAARNKSSTHASTSWRFLPLMEWRATMTIWKWSWSLDWLSRYASRMSRRARLRATALPTLRLVTIPTVRGWSGTASTWATAKLP